MVDDPKTKDQAEALLNQYYEQAKAEAKQRQEKNTLPEEPNLLSWNLRDDGVMVVVDGASGRKLEFAPESPFDYIEQEVKKIQRENAKEKRARLKAEAKAAKT
jgi:hypothetical protein